MSRFVLDASVACGWYFDEVASAACAGWAKRLLDGEIELVVPRLHFLEVGNVLRARVRRGALDRRDALEILSVHRATPLIVSDPDPEITLERAIDLDATFYDATYVALAEELDVPLLTAERSTRPWIQQLGKRAIIVR